MLMDSIAIYAKKIEDIKGWIDGGKGMFMSTLSLIFDNLMENKLEGIAYEDMFQLVLLDILCNAKEYGINQQHFYNIGVLLEKTGSGSHTNWDYTPEQLGKLVDTVWAELYRGIQSGTIPKNSIAYKGILAIGGGVLYASPPPIFKEQFKSEKYNDANSGGWIYGSAENRNFSPMVRIVILSNLLKDGSLDKNQVDIVLKGKVSELDELVKKLSDGKYNTALDNLFGSDDGWQNLHDKNKPLPEGVEITIDYSGFIAKDYLIELYTNYPGRDLFEEEVEEINRIGDQIKMIQQILKYWNQLLTDEQLAMARNI